MPWLHRWVGTPLLTTLINLLYGASITDCGTGFRCVRKEWFLSNPHRATGMEFASENLIRACKSNARVIEIPGGLRRGSTKRQPHLRTWRDGMRHLICILAEWSAPPKNLPATSLPCAPISTRPSLGNVSSPLEPRRDEAES